jgi:hypothetical protein
VSFAQLSGISGQIEWIEQWCLKLGFLIGQLG